MAKAEVTGSVQPKNNTFYVVLNITDENDKRKQKWIPTGLPIRGNKTKAKEAMNQLILEFNEKQTLQISTQSLSDIEFMTYLRSWLAKKQSSIQEMTVSSYRMLIEGKINRYFTPMGLMLREVTADHIEDFFEHLYEGGITSNTVLHYYAVLMTAFKDAVRKKNKNKLLSVNPMDDVDRPGDDDYQAAFYSTKEVLQLLEVAKGDPLYTIIVITAFYGLRRSEVLGIKWNAIDFDNNKITIRHKVFVLKDSNRKRVIKGSDNMKTKASLRSFPLIPQVREALLAEKQRQTEYQRVFKGSYDKTYAEYICVWPDGKLISPDYVTRHFPVILRQNVLRSIRFHDLRHTCASLLVAAGIPMKMIQEWLGHSVYQTTANLYSHLAVDTKNTVAETLAGQLTGIGAESAVFVQNH